jgi:hypothetical protein
VDTATNGHVNAGALLRIHAPEVHAIDPRAPLQLGNGNFAVAVDATGLQTFPEAYPGPGDGTLLGTMAQWGWHTMPGGEGFSLEEAYRGYDTPHGRVPFVDLSTELWGASTDGTGAGGTPDGGPAEHFFRANPHRLHLGQIGLDLPRGVTATELTDIEQGLDLGLGLIVSRFVLRRARYVVHTAVDTRADRLIIRVAKVGGQRLGLRLAFPYGSEEPGNAADWTKPTAHASEVRPVDGGWLIERTLDDTTHWVRVTVPGAQLARVGPQEFIVARTVQGEDRVAWINGILPRASAWLEAVIEFGQVAPADPPPVDAAYLDTAVDWADYWRTGGLIDLHDSDHPAASELERRIVLSQYLLRVNSVSPLPVAETGLLLNSWRGKFHLEMQWWHLASFAQWGHPEFLERSLAWYGSTLGSAQALARRHHLPGARWLKSSGPEGRETPSSIGSFLIWQQPHPIYLAELVYRAKPTPETLDRYADLVFATAEFMAAYPSPGPTGLALGPPLIPAQECYAELRRYLTNPTFELVYWHWGLMTAATWCERLGRDDQAAAWRAVAERLARPEPHMGRYPAIPLEPWTIQRDHPSHLAALGVVPRTGRIDDAIMTATLDGVLDDWDWATTWGWDYPMLALTATRLHRPDLATKALLLPTTKNMYLVNGHNWQTPDLPAYLPGNGGLLLAVGLMAAGWDGSEATPGFGPGWVVRHDRIARLP